MSLLDFNQQPTTSDYAKFIGKNSDYYMQKFDEFSIKPTSFHASWHWPAFFATWWWFLYRKMYLWAALYLVCICIPYVNFVSWFGWAIAANHLYYRHVHTKISDLKCDRRAGYAPYLVSRGGVHRWVPPIAFTIALIPILFAISFFSMGTFGS